MANPFMPDNGEPCAPSLGGTGECSNGASGPAKAPINLPDDTGTCGNCGGYTSGGSAGGGGNWCCCCPPDGLAPGGPGPGGAPPSQQARSGGTAPPSNGQADLPPRYVEAWRLAGEGRYDEARKAFARILRRPPKRNARLRALIENDLAVLDAVEGKFDEAREGWKRAIRADGELLLARLNRDLVAAAISLAEGPDEVAELKLVQAPAIRTCLQKRVALIVAIPSGPTELPPRYRPR